MFHPLQHQSFQLICPSFLLSKFASQLKIIKSVMRFWILGIYVSSSVLMVLGLRFQVSESQVSSPRDPVPGSRVSLLCVPGSSVPGLRAQIPGFRTPWSRVSWSRVPGFRVSGSQDSGSQGLVSESPWSRVSAPDYRLRPGNHFY